MAVSVTINGQAIQAEEGQTILQAAGEHGIRIPTLCYHKDLSSTGSCRMCVVEVTGSRCLQAACTTQVWNGMEIQTASEKVLASRKLSLELMLANHPQDCIICEASGECELQDLAYEYQVTVPAWGSKGGRYPVDSDPNPFIRVDMNRCILCRRCVQACQCINDVEVIDVFYRGSNSYIGFGANSTMQESLCEFCGSCVAVCPTGALTEKKGFGKGRVWEVRKVRTTCPYCGVGCQLELHVKGDQIVRVRGVEGAQPNQGFLCVKGRFGYDFVYSKDRLTTPLIREGNGFREAGWDEALGLIATKFQQIIQESGPDALAGVSCSRSINEDSYYMQRLFREVLGTNNIDNCART